MVIRNIIRHLDRTVYEPVAACMYHSGESTEWFHARGIKTVNFDMKGPLNGWADFLVVKRMADFIKREKIDLVHTHLVRADIFGRLAARKCSVPVISTVHNTEEHHDSKRLMDRLVRFMDKKTMACAESIITVSEAVKQYVCALYQLSGMKFEVIHNGIDTEVRVDELDSKAWGIKEGEVILCTVARLHKQKGIETLVRAVKTVHDKGYKVRSLVVGEGDLKEKISRLIEELEAPVSLTGFQSDVYPFINSCHIFILPSNWEGFGLSLVEAMNCGKPVIASRVGGIPEVVEENVTGLLCCPSNVDSLADSIIQLIENPDSGKKMGLAGKERVEKLFSSQVMSKKYENIYKRLT